MHKNRQLLERRSKCKKNTEVVSIAISFSVCTSIFGFFYLYLYLPLVWFDHIQFNEKTYECGWICANSAKQTYAAELAKPD